ncbi:MAG: LysR substrate-binding domain-containing protein [Gammaproteobacteria bacterium]|nr:LysR substrate-binding domain-containing protein [Gammaproteobacteria bacterium]MDH3537823.1 LysR substrate-binding domain-containing protein [Gammaproteobacteria bacterium]
MRGSIPSLNWLRVFEAAARQQSFARAAELLNMSTSAVSQQIKALENHFGEALFKRGARQVELTDAGHAFLPAVRQSLMTIEETAGSLFGQEKEHTLTLQADLIFTTAWLAPRLPAFDRLHPRVQLHLTGAYRDPDYQRPGAELKILFGPVHRSWAQCDRLFDERIYPVAHPEVAASIETPMDFLDHRLIQISTHRINWNQVLQDCGIDTVPTRQLCFVENTQVALALAASGYGIALARLPTTDNFVGRLGLVPCEVSPGVQSSEAYYLVYQNLESLSGPARKFHAWLLDQAGNQNR